MLEGQRGHCYSRGTSGECREHHQGDPPWLDGPASAWGFCYDVLNRGNARAEVFHKDEGLRAFLRTIGAACLRVPMRVMAYCLMPNHFRLVLWPGADGKLSRWMHWLLTTYIRRYLRHSEHSGHG